MTDAHEACEESCKEEDWYAGGFIAGLLTARYYALRYNQSDKLYDAAVPSDAPDVITYLLMKMSRAAIDERIFRTSWRSLDHLLLCDSTEELEQALAFIQAVVLQ